MLSYCERTVHLYCYTGCTPTVLSYINVLFLKWCEVNVNVWSLCEVYSLLWDTGSIYLSIVSLSVHPPMLYKHLYPVFVGTGFSRPPKHNEVAYKMVEAKNVWMVKNVDSKVKMKIPRSFSHIKDTQLLSLLSQRIKETRIIFTQNNIHNNIHTFTQVL